MNTYVTKNTRNTDRRVPTFIVALGVSLSLVAPTFLTTFASAAQLTSRSVEVSSSAAGATNVTYNVSFTSTGAAGAAVIEFCSNSPFIPSTCTPPTGFDASSATGGSGFTDVTASTNKVIAAGTIAATTPISIVLSGINNPTTTDPLYARIVTYDTKAHAIADYSSTDLKQSGSQSDIIDQGGAAISVTDKIGVSAAVLETMTFCVAGEAPGTNCDLTGKKKPTLALGQSVGSVVALSPDQLSTGDIFTQISTNASGGAIVSLKSSATGCGGLVRTGAPGSCDIAPAGTTGTFAAGTAKFGLLVNAATTGTGGSGTYQVHTGSVYDNTNYRMNYVAGNASGVTGPYGDQLLDTDGAPVNNMNMKLTFAASASNTTPAGNYSADMSLIATGTF